MCICIHTYTHNVSCKPPRTVHVRYVYMYIYICMCIHTYTNTCIRMYIYTNLQSYMHVSYVTLHVNIRISAICLAAAETNSC